MSWEILKFKSMSELATCMRAMISMLTAEYQSCLTAIK
jgi:hypothetical protein